jgi:hypothetical protein
LEAFKGSLPLNTQYHVIDKKYIPLMDGYGLTCDNCGKLIANIATVTNDENKTYQIGFDCLENILINNSLISQSDVLDYEKVKAMIPKIIRFSKVIKEQMSKNPITGLRFEKPQFGDFITFYWLLNNQPNSRNNDYVKLKNMDFDFLITTLKHIFPKLDIIIA